MNAQGPGGTERDVLAHEALQQIPIILTLMDRNRHSPTYGCFDRNYWHYRIIDFPSGMAQEFVLPLALAYSLDIPGNPYYQKASIKEWVEAGILYAAASAHSDGSCDDYFPFERAGGAAAFSLLACLDAYRISGLDNQSALAFFEKRADWLAGHQESGRLSNHQALIALCLELTKALAAAVAFATHFIHPDGSFGGEYGSRNTYNFFPHGFELVGRTNPKALVINDLFLKGVREGRGPSYADDHIIGHHTWNYLLAWQDFVPDRPETPEREQGRTYFPVAKLLVERRGGITLYAALNKGGVFKAFCGDRQVCSDTQLSVQIKGTPARNAVGHLVDDYSAIFEDDEITVEGALGWAKQTRMTTVNLIGLHVVMYTVGQFFPDLIRQLLQRMLITERNTAPYTFKRSFLWEGDSITVEDELSAETWDNVAGVALGVDQTSIYVVMSRTFQAV